MAERFEGKVALVTGASSGIGKATAIAFGREGASVVVAARREEESLQTVAEIEAAGGEAIFVRTDVSDASNVKNPVSKTVSTYGRLDCAFNNAGVGSPSGIKRLHEYDEEDWDFITGINEKGVWLCMKYQIAQMLEQNPAGDAGSRGVIVNDSSVAGLRAGPTSLYTAVKHSVVGLTRRAAVEYGRDGIRVNAICPGVIETDMVSRAVAQSAEIAERFASAGHMGRWGQPGEIASAVLFMCSDEASFMTGQAMAVDGGITA
ncbi:MAG: SDR family oxidoreductase [Chloroflexi bacterium]|nr:SDR family oxidoreductase [Chloroflexota bacterium]